MAIVYPPLTDEDLAELHTVYVEYASPTEEDAVIARLLAHARAQAKRIAVLEAANWELECKYDDLCAHLQESSE